MSAGKSKGRWLGQYHTPRVIARRDAFDVFACLDERGLPRLAVVAPAAQREATLDWLSDIHRNPSSPLLCKLVDETVVGATRLWVFEFRPVLDLAGLWQIPDIRLSVAVAAIAATVLGRSWGAVERSRVNLPADFAMDWSSIFVDRRGRLGALAIPAGLWNPSVSSSPSSPGRDVQETSLAALSRSPQSTGRRVNSGHRYWDTLAVLDGISDLRRDHIAAVGVPSWTDLDVTAMSSQCETIWRALEPDRTEVLVFEELAAAAERAVLRQGLNAPDIPRTLADRYTVERVIAGGGGATVAIARDESTGERVAVKSLPHDAPKARRARFRREARVMAAAQHPALMSGGDLLEVDGRLHAVMEFLEGQTLRRWWMASRPSLAQILVRLSQVADGLDALHCAGVVHGDVKPSNVIMHPLRGAVLVDYGVARWCVPKAAGSSVDTKAAAEARGFGSLRYLAPESRRDGLFSPASDVFAWGVTAAELIAGPESSWGRHVLDAGAAFNREGLPSPLVGLLDRCLSTDPAGRPSPLELVERLAAVVRRLTKARNMSEKSQTGPSDTTLTDVGGEATTERLLPLVWLAVDCAHLVLPNGRKIRLGHRLDVRRCFKGLHNAWVSDRGQWNDRDLLAQTLWPGQSAAGRSQRLEAVLSWLAIQGLGGIVEVTSSCVRLVPEVEFVVDI